MKVIPKKQRIKAYKRALEIIENDLMLNKLGIDNNDGLCLILDCIVFNTHYKRRSMAWLHTPNRFPEFKKYYKHGLNLKFKNLYNDNSNLWRRVVLRLILEELKANEEI